MEHKLLRGGGEQYLPFARSRIKALQATGMEYASQKFDMGDATVHVRITPEHEYIDIQGGAPGYIWAWLVLTSTNGTTTTKSSRLYCIPNGDPANATLYSTIEEGPVAVPPSPPSVLDVATKTYRTYTGGNGRTEFDPVGYGDVTYTFYTGHERYVQGDVFNARVFFDAFVPYGKTAALLFYSGRSAIATTRALTGDPAVDEWGNLSENIYGDMYVTNQTWIYATHTIVWGPITHPIPFTDDHIGVSSYTYGSRYEPGIDIGVPAVWTEHSHTDSFSGHSLGFFVPVFIGQKLVYEGTYTVHPVDYFADSIYTLKKDDNGGLATTSVVSPRPPPWSWIDGPVIDYEIVDGVSVPRKRTPLEVRKWRQGPDWIQYPTPYNQSPANYMCDRTNERVTPTWPLTHMSMALSRKQCYRPRDFQACVFDLYSGSTVRKTMDLRDLPGLTADFIEGLTDLIGRVDDAFGTYWYWDENGKINSRSMSPGPNGETRGLFLQIQPDQKGLQTPGTTWWKNAPPP